MATYHFRLRNAAQSVSITEPFFSFGLIPLKEEPWIKSPLSLGQGKLGRSE